MTAAPSARKMKQVGTIEVESWPLMPCVGNVNSSFLFHECDAEYPIRCSRVNLRDDILIILLRSCPKYDYRPFCCKPESIVLDLIY